MVELCLLRPLPGEADRWEWVTVAPRATLPAAVRQGPLPEFASLPHGDILLLLDTRDLLLTRILLPQVRPQLVAQALPFALEEQLVSPVEELSFAFRRLAGNEYVVAVAERRIVEQASTALAERGLQLTGLVPDVLCLPREPGTWTVAVDGQSVWVRTGDYLGFKASRAELPLLLAHELAHEPPPDRLIVHEPPGSREPLDAWPADLALPVERRTGKESLLALCAEPVDVRRLLLFASPRQTALSSNKRRRVWQIAAGFAACAAVAHGLVLQHLSTRLHAEASALEQGIDARFREIFPATKRIVDVRVQAAQEIDSLRGNTAQTPEFLDLLHAVGGVAVALPSGDLRFKAINYADGVLDVRVQAPDMTQLESFREALSREAIPAETVSAESTEHAVIGLLRIRGATS